jgi:CysZ protein
MNATFVEGFSSHFRSAGFANKNGLKKYFIIPFIINIAVLSAIFFVSFFTIQPAVLDLLAGPEWYMKALRFLISPVLFIALWIITALCYTLLGSIAVAPFLDLISQKTESVLRGTDITEPFSFSSVVADIFRALKSMIKLLVLWILISFGLLFVNALPLAGPALHIALNFFTAAFFMGFTFIEYPLDRERISFGEKLSAVWKIRRAAAGLGTAFMITAFIPLVGYLSMNMGAVAGTLLFVKYIKPVEETPEEKKS